MSKIPTKAEADAAMSAAQATLAELQKKQADQIERVEIIRLEKEQLSFDAHTAGGKSKDRLVILNRELSQLELVAGDIAIAVKHAEAKLRQAEEIVEAARDYETADGTAAAASELVRLGAELQRRLDEFVALYPAYKRAASAGGVYHLPFIDATRRCLQTAMHRIGLHEMPLPFAHRVTFGESSKAFAAVADAQSRKMRARLLGLVGRKEAA